jgi:hypothetical protein
LRIATISADLGPDVKEEGPTTRYCSKNVELGGKRISRDGEGLLKYCAKKRLHCGRGVWEPVGSIIS